MNYLSNYIEELFIKGGNIVCPTCSGEGEVTETIINEDKGSINRYGIECKDCKGKGYLTPNPE